MLYRLHMHVMNHSTLYVQLHECMHMHLPCIYRVCIMTNRKCNVLLNTLPLCTSQNGETALMIAERSDESNPETIKLLKEAAEPHVYLNRVHTLIIVLLPKCCTTALL